MAKTQGDEDIYPAPLPKDVVMTEGSACAVKTLGTCTYTRITERDEGRGRTTVSADVAFVGNNAEIVLEDVEIMDEMRGRPTTISKASFRNGNLLTFNDGDACELSDAQKQAARALKQASHVALELTKIPYLNMPDTGKDMTAFTSGIDKAPKEFCRPGRAAKAP